MSQLPSNKHGWLGCRGKSVRPTETNSLVTPFRLGKVLTEQHHSTKTIFQWCFVWVTEQYAVKLYITYLENKCFSLPILFLYEFLRPSVSKKKKKCILWVLILHRTQNIVRWQLKSKKFCFTLTPMSPLSTPKDLPYQNIPWFRKRYWMKKRILSHADVIDIYYQPFEDESIIYRKY